MSLMKFDIAKHATKGLFSIAAMALYDIFGEGISYKNPYVVDDSFTFGLANVLSGMSADIVLNLIGYANDGLIPLLTEPLLNGFIYDYVYNTFIRYNSDFGRVSKRSSTMNFGLGVLGNLSIKWVQNPLMSLWGLKSY